MCLLRRIQALLQLVVLVALSSGALFEQCEFFQIHKPGIGSGVIVRTSDDNVL